jgi:hypothetical protein
LQFFPGFIQGLASASSCSVVNLFQEHPSFIKGLLVLLCL